MIKAAWCRWLHAGAYVLPYPGGGYRCEKCGAWFRDLAAVGRLKLDAYEAETSWTWRARLDQIVRKQEMEREAAKRQGLVVFGAGSFRLLPGGKETTRKLRPMSHLERRQTVRERWAERRRSRRERSA